MRLLSLFILVFALLNPQFAMPYCDIFEEFERCHREDCYAAGGRCLPELKKSVPGTASFIRSCRQGLKFHESTLRFSHWSLWQGTKDPCMDCCCRPANPPIIQSQQELREFMKHMKRYDDSDLDENAVKRKIEGDSALCEMRGRNCDVTRCSEDGIRCLMRSDDKCTPHHVNNGRATVWTSSNVPATCQECVCKRKSEAKKLWKSYILAGKDLRKFTGTKRQKLG
jgi:hypothetical protein